jgi:RimJ/RimL family protein N-acetyltransferase
MDLVQCGAVTNRYQRTYPGKSLTSYAIGTSALMAWLDNNPLVEFQSIERVFNPLYISQNPRYVAVLPARKVDLSGRIALHTGQGNVGSGPGEVVDFFNGALLSEGGRTIFALPSRNRGGEPNILASVREFPNQFSLWEAVSMIVTEYGIVSLNGRSVRERAQALIDIAHPDDRAALVAEAKKRRVIYPDQIYLAQSAHLYPAEITAQHTFAGGVAVRFRAIKPSDEEEMRRLFYRFSEKTVYARYFTPLKIMPHARMQEYVNVDYHRVLSIVGVVGAPGHDRVIAEARFAREEPNDPYAEVAFVVDEDYQNIGVATFMCRMLSRLGRERQLKGFTADVLSQNKSMLRVFEKIADCALQARLVHGVYQVTLEFTAPAAAAGDSQAPGR